MDKKKLSGFWMILGAVITLISTNLPALKLIEESRYRDYSQNVYLSAFSMYSGDEWYFNPEIWYILVGIALLASGIAFAIGLVKNSSKAPAVIGLVSSCCLGLFFILFLILSYAKSADEITSDASLIPHFGFFGIFIAIFLGLIGSIIGLQKGANAVAFATQTVPGVQPVAQAYTQPVAPVYQQPVMPVYQQPVVPTYAQPVAPVYQQPGTSKYQPPVNPNNNQPGNPTQLI